MKNKQTILASVPLAILFFFTSCKTRTKEPVKEKLVELPKHLINSIDIHQLETIEIDSCEYIS